MSPLPATFGVVAVAEKLPAVLFAVSTGDVAMPFAPVVTVGAPEKLPLGPVAGTLNVTGTPLTGLPTESVTKACNGAANTWDTIVICGVLPTAAIREA